MVVGHLHFVMNMSYKIPCINIKKNKYGEVIPGSN
jgi:hypothetical protein